MKTVTVERAPDGVRVAMFDGEALARVPADGDLFHTVCVVLRSRGLKGRVRFVTTGARVMRTMDIAEGAEHREYRDPKDGRPLWSYPFGAISSSKKD